tara:strand:+ start:2386 stop:3114 length:729 start_codon:yes stop_codon:yes gene_type:complete
MARRSRPQNVRPRSGKQKRHAPIQEQHADYSVRPIIEPLQPQTEAQGHYMLAIQSSPLTIATGPAGTGKTYICAAMAADALMSRRVDRIIITRPVVEAQENIGFLPGEVDEKFAPYFEPFRDVLEERLGKGQVKALIASGRIVASPLAFMRGKTFKDAFVILDEAQNTTTGQMKLFLTRLGEGVRCVVNGDVRQTDLRGATGLEDAIARLSHLRSVAMVEFTVEDIVRSGLARDIVIAYERS